MNKSIKIWRSFAGIAILAALIVSFIGQLIAPTIPTYFGRILGYFSYFTEYSNILVMLWFINKGFLNGRIKFLNKESVRGALTLYICIAGMVFFFVLNKAWDQHGIAKLESYTLHGFAPIAFILDWIVFSKKGTYTYKNILSWIVFPIVYLFWALFIGNIIGVYPYPFLDLNAIGFSEFLNYLVYLVIGFLGFSFIIVSLDKLFNKLQSLKGNSNNITEYN